ncbi:MAG: heparan-alpha-glucosaminide N-acetyltransferase domain-containing protein [Legionella sp.]|jgi:predicted acyltransferase
MENKRIVSVDVFRGITIALMILVNSPGTRFPYPLLDHAPWNGCTFADLVFPSFLFIVGLTIVISMNSYITTNKFQLSRNILKRSIILFAIGLLLNALPNHFELASFRFYGILQRIAVCYCICAFIYLNTSVKTQVLVFLSLLLAYCWLMTMVPVPGMGVNVLTANGSWVAYVDQMLFSSKHLLDVVYDPEGFLSTIPAIASTLLGVLTGSLLLSHFSKQEKMCVMIGLGWILLILGWLWSFSFPINKNLWTSSYVLWSGGYALLAYALCYLIIDIWDYQKWSLPFKILGMNALFIFVLHVVLLKLQALFSYKLHNGSTGNLRHYITDLLFANYSPQAAALLYSIFFLGVNFLVAAFLFRRKIFIKI